MSEPLPIPNPGPVYEGQVGAPLVVLLHDRFGRLPGLLHYGAALARVGLRVAMPDLYDGVATDEPGVAAELAARTPIGSSLSLIDDTIRHERALGSSKIAGVGFDHGGVLALLHAQSAEMDAVVAYDATLTPEQHGLIPCAVLLHFAEGDAWPTGAGPEVFEARLQDHGTPVTTHTYPAARHGFANATIRADWDANAAALAFARTAAFLQAQLIG